MTMAEYIDREEYCEKHCRCSNEYCDRESCPIWKAPAADVAPVVHGRWNVIEGRRLDNAICSNCGRRFQAYYEAYSFCPNCGAKMDGGDNDAAD